MKLLNIIILFALLSCGSDRRITTILRVKGSDTMLQLTQKLASEYMRINSNISIYVEGGGTESGVKSLIRNEIDICIASRTLESEEIKQIAGNSGTVAMSFLVAKDAIAVYLNSENPVRSLSINELKAIFTCKSKNWNQFGGKSQSIKIVSRQPNSGTYQYFKEHVLIDSEYCDDLVVCATTSEVVEEVSQYPNAIGYGGIGVKNDVAHVSIEGIEPSETNIRSNKYPLTRYLYFYTLDSPTGAAKDFINWVLSNEGQSLVKSSGLIPLWSISY